MEKEMEGGIAMEEVVSNPAAGGGEDKKEIFARVWKRVMADGGGQCPITWEEPGSRQSEAPKEEAASLPAPACQRGGRPHSDFPGACGVLGEACLSCAGLLQELVRRELADWREYQALARRAGGAPSRVLAGMAGEKKRRAKRLSAAYFLISGVKYWPEGEGVPRFPSYLGTLRRRFAQEQDTMSAYLAGAEATSDPCLQQLFWEHAQENWTHACQLRKLVEAF